MDLTTNTPDESVDHAKRFVSLVLKKMASDSSTRDRGRIFAPAAAEKNVEEIIRLRPKKRHCRRRRCRRSQFVFLSEFEKWRAIEIPLKEKMVAPAAKVSVPSHWYRSLIIEPLSKFPLAA
jgi:hypothetical protein